MTTVPETVPARTGLSLADPVEPPAGPPPVSRPDREPQRPRDHNRERRKKLPPEDPPPSDPEDPKGRQIDIQAHPRRPAASAIAAISF